MSRRQCLAFVTYVCREVIRTVVRLVQRWTSVFLVWSKSAILCHEGCRLMRSALTESQNVERRNYSRNEHKIGTCVVLIRGFTVLGTYQLVPTTCPNYALMFIANIPYSVRGSFWCGGSLNLRFSVHEGCGLMSSALTESRNVD